MIGGIAFATASESGWAERPSGVPRTGATAGPGTAPPPVCPNPSSANPSSAGPSSAGPSSAVSPPSQKVWLGVSLDQQALSVHGYASRIGHDPADIEATTGIPATAGDRVGVAEAARSASRTGAVLLLTVEPRAGLAGATDARITDLAGEIGRIERAGVPTIVRWAPEMNGSWYPWGQDPRAYVATFRRAATIIGDRAPRTAMMWAPNYGGGYPFGRGHAPDGRYGPDGRYSPAKGSARYRQLDTNHDGRVNQHDDPYAPYWPGKRYVDWVGLSVYYWSERYPARNSRPSAGMFEDKLRGSYRDRWVDDRAVPDFYRRYGVDEKLPVAVPETAAFYVHGEPGPDEIAVKRSWWRQVFDPGLRQRLPDLKMINWFEWRTKDVRGGVVVDWEVTNGERTRRDYQAALPRWAAYASGHPRC